MILIEPKTKCEVDAIKECIDLLHNGYFIMFSAGESGSMYYKFRHSRNGRILSVKIYFDHYEIWEGSKALKCVEYPEELVSD